MTARAGGAVRSKRHSLGATFKKDQPNSASLSAVELMLQRLDRLRQRLAKESRDVDELMALNEAIRIVRMYFGK